MNIKNHQNLKRPCIYKHRQAQEDIDFHTTDAAHFLNI